MAPPPPGRRLDVGGLRMHLYAAGCGQPAVILEAAVGASALSWSLVQPAIARLTLACSYDRAGLGWSDPGPMPRTAGRIAAELRALLSRAGIEPPFLLVGHSFGGLVIQVFARRHLSDVAGLVFVDPAHPEDWVVPEPKEELKLARAIRMCRVGRWGSRVGLTRAAAAMPGVGVPRLVRAAVRMMNRGRISKEDAGIVAPVWKLPPDARAHLGWLWSRPSFFAALGSQLESMPTSAAEALEAARGGFGDVPLTTISQTDPGAYRIRQQEALAALSTRGRHVIAANSGHWIPLDEPQIVIDAIRSLL